MAFLSTFLNRAWLLGIGGVLLVAVAVGFFLARERPAPPGLVEAVNGDGFSVSVLVGDAVDGQRRLDVWLRDQQGRPVAAEAVELRFSMPYICADQIVMSLPAVDAGRFQTRGTFFWMAGGWLADVTWQQPGGPTRQARLVVPVAIADVASPFAPGQPFAPELLVSGKSLYVANCASCHGAGGRGDGPSGIGLSPRPVDFSQHMVAGKHTDAQLFLTIRNGGRSSAMPAWGVRLSEEQTWQLVAYLRSFAQSTPAENAARP